MKRKNSTFLLIALLLPVLYHFISTPFAHFVYLQIAYPLGWYDILYENYMFVDVLFCTLASLLVLPIFKAVRSRENRTGETPPQAKYVAPHRVLLLSTLFALGISGMSGLWQHFAYYRLSEYEVIAESLESFEAAFALPDGNMPFFWYAFSLILSGPILEELLFRGILHHALQRTMHHPVLTAVLTGLYFGLWHLEPVQVVYTSLMGIILSAAYFATGSFIYPVLIHMLNNLIAVLIQTFSHAPLFHEAITLMTRIAILPMLYVLVKMTLSARETPTERA